MTSWRGAFGSQFWFGSVQLAAYVQDASFDWRTIASERESQEFVLNLPNTALATAIDLGDPPADDPPFGTVHPRLKQPLGARLAANALAQVYGQAGVPHLSPRFASASAATNGRSVTVTVSFEPASVADGPLVIDNSAKSASCPPSVPADECGFPTIVMSDGSAINATLAVAGVTATLTGVAAADGLTAVACSYAFDAWPVASLFSAAGFPALPFNKSIAA